MKDTIEPRNEIILPQEEKKPLWQQTEQVHIGLSFDGGNLSVLAPDGDFSHLIYSMKYVNLLKDVERKYLSSDSKAKFKKEEYVRLKYAIEIANNMVSSYWTRLRMELEKAAREQEEKEKTVVPEEAKS